MKQSLVIMAILMIAGICNAGGTYNLRGDVVIDTDMSYLTIMKSITLSVNADDYCRVTNIPFKLYDGYQRLPFKFYEVPKAKKVFMKLQVEYEDFMNASIETISKSVMLKYTDGTRYNEHDGGTFTIYLIEDADDVDDEYEPIRLEWEH
jgi:hypothetical protein